MTYRTEHPETAESVAPYASVLLAAGWADTSWRNDLNSSFEVDLGPGRIVRVWVADADVEQREEGIDQFMLEGLDGDSSGAADWFTEWLRAEFVMSNDWADIVATLQKLGLSI